MEKEFNFSEELKKYLVENEIEVDYDATKPVHENTEKRYHLFKNNIERLNCSETFADHIKSVDGYDTEETKKLMDFISNSEKCYVVKYSIMKHKGSTLAVESMHTTVDDFIKMVEESEETDFIVQFFKVLNDKIEIRFAQKSFKVKLPNNNYYPKHDFEFEVSKLFISEKTLIPYKKISFDLNPEMLQDGAVTEDEYTEIICEKLKQDFKKLIKEKLTKHD